MGKNVKYSKFLVAATFEKAITSVLAEMVIHNPEVSRCSSVPACLVPQEIEATGRRMSFCRWCLKFCGRIVAGMHRKTL